MTEPWPDVSLGEVASIHLGQAPASTVVNDSGDGLPFLQGCAEFGHRTPTAVKWCSAPLKVAEPGDILVSVRAPVGELNIAAHRLCIGRGLAAIRCRAISPDFAWHVIGRQVPRLARVAQGSTFAAVNRADLESLRLPLPPLAEQRRIATVLSAVDEAIEKTSAVVKQLQSFRRVALQSLLGDIELRRKGATWAPVGELAALVTSGSRGWAQYYADSGALFIRSQNIRSGVLDLQEHVYVKPPAGVEGRRTQVEAGDVLVTITGNSVGNVAAAECGLGEAYVSQHVGLIRLKDPTLGPYVALYFSPGAPGNLQVVRARYGQSKPGLGLGELRGLSVPIPAREHIRHVEQVIGSLTARQRTEVANHEGLVHLKKSLASALLSGAIRAESSSSL